MTFTTNPTSIAAIESDLERAILRLEAEDTPITDIPYEQVDDISLASISVDEAFNVRGQPLDEYHLHQLGRALSISGGLPPLLVVAVRNRTVLIDGHHRLEAYRRAKRTFVPVEWCDKTIRQAVLEAAARASRTVLTLSNGQRQDLAWRLANANFTLNDVTRNTGISRAQVGIMRKIKRALGQEAAQHATWFAARQAAEGKEPIQYTEEEREAQMEAWQQALADRMRRAFSNRLAKQPEVTAGALAIHLGRRLPEVVRELLTYLPEDTFEEGEFEF